MSNFSAIAQQFESSGQVIEVREFGNGNINDTYLVTTDAADEKYFVLQRINTNVFRQPKLIMQNMRAFTEHMYRRASEEGHPWKMPRVIATQDGQDFFLDSEGNFWRAISFIHGAQSFSTVQNMDHAREVGHALGMFHYLINDLAIDRLADTLEGFHIVPRYLQSFDLALAENRFKTNAEVTYCLNFVDTRRDWSHVLENARKQGRLHLRPVHGDPKVDNVMIEKSTGIAISLVDLDTVKPGLIHYDIGDCIRSACNPLGEETEDWEAVHFEPQIGAAILEGYLAQAQRFLTPTDYVYLFDSIRLLTFELGLRFITDYMAGNTYFKVKDADHNLRRALVQFKLTESIEAHEAEIHNIIQSVVSRTA
ncbi:MAG TPA: aminoglycoside phosphotransferase family protein [Anaerolineales bacterium]|nr:aminoglycoside phosphotransferase family protein [Anaerolineales bacterium]